MKARDGFRLAPRGIVRAAALPLDLLNGFGEPELHGAGTGSSESSAPPAGYERAYQATLAREREHLWRHTYDDGAFRKALLLASRSACLRAQSAAGRRDGPRNRAMRLSEHTLYRYLARATGRVTPHGLWAGIGEVRTGAVAAIERMPARCDFTPDLRPFQQLMRALAPRPAYQERASWCLNPSLQWHEPDRWRFLKRSAGGAIEARELSFVPALAPIIAHLARMPAMPLVAAARELAGAMLVAGTDAATALLRELAAGGVLVGGLDLPEQFATIWEALNLSSERLLPDDRRRWRTATARLHEHCAALADAVWALPFEAFAARHALAVAEPATLAAELGLAPPDTQDNLRCDLRLPWRVTLDLTQHGALAHALADYEQCWQDGVSAAASARELRRRALAARLGDGCSLLEASTLVASLGADHEAVWPPPTDIAEPETARRLAAWEALLGSAEPEVTLARAASPSSRAAAPWGCWLAGLAADGSLRAHGISDLPTLASTRAGALFDMRRHDQWLAVALRTGSRAAGFAVTTVRAPYEANPNALLCPRLLDTAVAPWSADNASASLRDARLCTEAVTGHTVLRLHGDARSWMVLPLGTANLQAQDPLLEALLWTGFRDSPGRAGRAIDMPTAREIGTRSYAPRVKLPHGALLNARRSVLGPELARLRSERGSARFWTWQKIAARLGWPPLLEVASAGHAFLHVPRDSPLAVEAVCKGLADHSRFLIVQEAPADAALPIPGSGAHMVELALPFLRHNG